MCRRTRDEETALLNGEKAEKKDLGSRCESCQTHYFQSCSRVSEIQTFFLYIISLKIDFFYKLSSISLEN